MKKMTLEKLAEMTQNGFMEMKRDMDKRFGLVDERLEDIDTYFDSVDKRFEGIDRRFEAIDKRFEAIDKRFEDIDERHKLFAEQMNLMQADIHDIKIALGPMTRSVIALEDDVRKLDIRMKRVEKKVGIAR